VQIYCCRLLTTLKRPRWKVRTTTQGVTAASLLPPACTRTVARLAEAVIAAICCWLAGRAVGRQTNKKPSTARSWIADYSCKPFGHLVLHTHMCEWLSLTSAT